MIELLDKLRWKLVEYLIGKNCVIANARIHDVEPFYKDKEEVNLIGQVDLIPSYDALVEKSQLLDYVSKSRKAMSAMFGGIGHAIKHYLSQSAAAEMMAFFNGYENSFDAFGFYEELIKVTLELRGKGYDV